MKSSCRKKIRSRFFAGLLAVLMVLSMIPEITVQAAKTSSWNGLADGELLIKDTITTITSGVVEHEVITNVPTGDQQRIDYIAEVALSDKIKIVAGYGKNDASSWGLTSTTSQAAAYEADHPGETVVAAINADFFNMATGEPLGALVMEGKEWHAASGRNYFGITRDGKAVIRSGDDLSDLETAVGGDAILVQNGEIIEENGAYGALKYSRCAIGIKADGTVVTFVTYGLRAPISCGRTYSEIAQMMKNAGCVSALALDGGGSATYCARPEGTDKLVVSNSPADGAEREVSSSLLIVSVAEATGIFDHAALSPNNEVYTPGSTIQFSANGVDTAGMPMELPTGTTWALAEESAGMGTIDSTTGLFQAGEGVGTVVVNLMQNENVVGVTTVELATPDSIYFSNDEVSLGFGDITDLGLVVRSKGRDINIKNGDIVWSSTNDALGTFNGNIFTSSDGESLNGNITATSKWDASVSGAIHVVVGMLPTVIWDFEDYVDPETGDVISASDYYIGNAERAGILTHSNYGRGGNESIEIVTIDDDEPVRFGSGALKLNYDFTNCGAVTEGACVGYASGRMEVPGTPTGIGVWVYAPEGMGITYEGPGTQSGFWLRGYVRDGNNSNQPYDFVLEPKACVDENGNWNGVQPGIYWEGWMYLEADLTHLAAPYAIQSGMTFRMMYVAGTNMGTKTSGSVYFDNLQFVYGTNIDDIDAPVVDSITVNGKELEDGMVIDTDTVDITAMFHDVQNKYTTGIDINTVRMYIDGVNVVNNDQYTYAIQSDGTMNYLYDLKLQDGTHTVTISLRDGFGNDISETRTFVIQTGKASDVTVTVTPVEETAIIGKTVSLEIRSSSDAVADSTTILRLGNLFSDYEVVFAEDYTGTHSYSKASGQITVHAVRKETDVMKAAENEYLIATVKVAIPTNLNASATFNYAVKGGNFTTSNGFYATYSETEAELPIGAEYTISAEPIIMSEGTGTVKVVNSAGNPASGVTIYLASDNSVIGVTDENGELVTDYFCKQVGKYLVYAKDNEGLLSFQYNVASYDVAQESLPYNVRFNAPEDASTQKNISWISNPLTEGQQTIRYAVSGTQDWKSVAANSEMFVFTEGGNMTATFNNVNLTELLPGTAYDYQVGVEDAWTEVATFTTAATDASSAKFFVLGDIQADDLTNISTISNSLKSGNYDFGIQTGDAVDNPNNYFDWEEYTDLFDDQKLGDVNMIQVLGNHELVGDALGSKVMFGLPASNGGSCYSRTYGNVYLAVINYTANTTQLNSALDWLKQDAKASDADWKILLMHQPPYYTNATGGNAEIYALVPNAVEEAGIDVVFSGHDHSLVRTNPLTDDMIDEENGVLYYICGTSGEKSYSITSQGKFDYDTIFALATLDFTATYLTGDATKDELTINIYDLNKGLMDTYTLQSECLKKGHTKVYDPVAKKATCAICGELVENYTGEILDANGNEYYMIAGITQREWITLGEEIRYYNPETGIREKLTSDETPSTCIIDGHCIYTSESGAQKRIEYTDAGGHEYKEQSDGSFVCSKCDHVRVNMTDCVVTLSYDTCTYTGKARTPATKAVAPNGAVLTKYGEYRDYYSTYTNNVEVGTASVTLTARKYGVYVNMNDWRGNCKGSVTVNYEILPDLPTNVKVAEQDQKAVITWTAAKSAPTYVIYASVDGENYKEIAATENTSIEVQLDENVNYFFKIGTRKAGTDGKVYESNGCTAVFTLAPKVTVGYREADGKPTLTWTALKNAEKYEVYRSTKMDGNYEKVFTTNYRTYTHISAKVDTLYYYKVRAVYADGTTSSYSAVVENTGRCAKVVANVNVNEDGQPFLTWEAVAGADGYDVYRADSRDGDFVKIATVTDVAYTDTTTVSNKSYSYKVGAITDKGNNGALSNAITVTTVAAVPEPVATNRYVDGKPALSWEPIEQGVSYEVYRSNTEDGKYVRVFTTTGTTYTHASSVVGNTYYYKVKVVFADGTYKFSKVVSASCIEPQFVVHADTRKEDGKPVLSWNRAEGAVSYQVYRSNTENGKYVRVFTTTGTTYTHASSVVGNTYYYKVKVVYANGTGVFSGIESAECREAQITLSTANRLVDGKPTLSWEKGDSVAEYQVYRATSENGKYVRVFTTKGTTYTHASSVVDHTYYYKVKTIFNNGSSAYSNVVSNTRVCGQPVVSTGNRQSDGKPTLKWNPVEGAASYQVYRSNTEDGKYVKVFTTTGTTYTHISAVAGNTYFYKVIALTENGHLGIFSNVYSNSMNEVQPAFMQNEVQIVETEAPVVEEETKETEAEAPAVEEEAKETEVEVPTVEEETKETEAEAPAVEEEAKETEVEAPAVEEETKETEVEVPTVEEEAEETEAEAPTVEEEAEETEAEAPTVEEETEETEAEAPTVEEEAEETEAEAPAVEEETKETEVEVPTVEETQETEM